MVDRSLVYALATTTTRSRPITRGESVDRGLGDEAGSGTRDLRPRRPRGKRDLLAGVEPPSEAACDLDDDTPPERREFVGRLTPERREFGGRVMSAKALQLALGET
jgi:hypothetical protein